VAQSVAPESRIVYVDNDPLVLAHAGPCEQQPRGSCDYLDATSGTRRAPGDAAGLLDFSQPVALMLMGSGPFTDDEPPIVSRLQAGLPSGSYFALYDGASTNDAFNLPAGLQRQRRGALSPAQPGAVSGGTRGAWTWSSRASYRWSVAPDPDTEQAEIYSYCGVGASVARGAGVGAGTQPV